MSLSKCSQTDVQEVDNKILKELICSVCMDYMLPPITLCKSGHNVCSICKPQLQHCPVCREYLLETRNISLENLSRETVFPCLNRKAGCKEVFEMSNIKEHLKECILGNHKCVFAKICKENCNWCGPLLNMKKHVKQMHKAEADTLNTEEPFQMLLAMKSETEFEPVRQILLVLEEMFLTMFKVVDGTFYCVVVHIGARANASRYKYTLRMRTGKEALSCSFTTASFMDNIEELLKNGECMALRLSCIKKFVKCSKLRMDIEIHEYGAEEEDDDDITEEQGEGDSEEK